MRGCLGDYKFMKVLIVSPYHGGSHGAWANGYVDFSQHEVTLLTLPDRFWKWRMHGGAVTLARKFNESELRPDLILATDMLDLTTFLALTRRNTAVIPSILFMHENQLTYPLPKNGKTGPMRRQLGERDQHYAFINYASMLAADGVCFNSRFHMNSFFDALRPFLKHFPEYNELGSILALQKKSSVLPVGVRFGDKRPFPQKNSPPLILWNQRWEYDKNPEDFFAALFALMDKGVEFEVAVCGQQFGKRPLIFQQAQEKLGQRIIHFGFAKKEAYQTLLWQADITVSTAYHEFFGVSIIEAIGCETFPILPNRLSYPELLPKAFHDFALYESQDDLINKLVWAVEHKKKVQELGEKMASFAQKYSWQIVAEQYDALFASQLN